jgi:hypothetical protein
MTVPHWPGMGANPKFVCKVHGENDWKGHLVCSKCGAAYTTMDKAASTHAPPRCKMCRERFMPIPGAKPRSHYYTAQPCCSLCFEDAPGGSFQDRHERESPYCLGEDCPFHGPHVRKLKRRAERNKGQRDASENAPSQETTSS